MKTPSDHPQEWSELRERLIGLGERSFRKSYYPELQRRLGQLERFRTLLDRTHDAILVAQLPSREIVDANSSACHQFGCPCEELVGRSLEEVIDLDHLVWPEGNDEDGKGVTTLYRPLTGKAVPVEVTLSLDDFGGETYVVVVARDLTDRLRAEEELRRNQNLLRMVLDSTDNAILALGPDLRVIYYNAPYLRLYPFDPSFMEGRPTIHELIGKACEMGIYPSGEAEVLIRRRLAHLKNSAQTQVLETPRTDGSLVEGFAATLPDGGYLLTFRDITERRRAEEALRASEERYRGLLRNLSTGVVVLDPGGGITLVNPAVLEMLGLGETEILGKTSRDPDWSLTREDGTPLPLEEYPPNRVLSGGKPVRNATVGLENRQTREAHWVLVNAYPVLGAKKDLQQVIVTLADITDRKRMEEALRESEERFRSIFQSAAAGMALLTAEGQNLQVNPALCQFLGYGREELLGMNLLEFTHPDDRDMTERLFGEVAAGHRKSLDYEKRYMRKDGTTVWGHATVAWVHDARRNPLYCIALVQDITERKLAEKALRYALEETEEARGRIDAILRSAADGLLVTDAEGRITLANPAAEELLGMTREEIEGMALPEAMERRIGSPETEASTAAGDSAPDAFDWEIFAPGRSAPRILQARMSTVEGRGGRPGGGILALRDVTREREIDRMKTEFISTAAHEFRTPLTTIRGFAQVLLEDGSLPEEERREFLTYIHDKAVALAGIVSDLLDVGRIESGQGLSLERAPCTPREMVREAAQAWKARPDRERFEVELEDPEEPLLVDRGKMGQVFDNLVSNAVKYSPSGSPVRICGQKREGSYLFAVEDRGVGMSSVEVAKVFDKFYRVDSSDTAVGGIGLGMSIVKNIVESHGGRIWVESSPGKGTTVRFALPLEGG